MIDLADIKRDISLIEYARNRGLKVSNAGKGACPFHPPDNNSSFSYFRGQDGYWHWQDFHDGSGGTIVDFVARLDNLDDAGACRKLLEEYREPRPSGKKKEPTPWERPSPGESLEAEYIYTDEQGITLYVKRRFKPKSFDYYHFADGKKMWKKGIRSVLFHLPMVISNSEIWLVEGEKDVLTLEGLGFAATTAGGENDWKDDFLPFFAAKDEVIVCWDTDAPQTGRVRAQAISKVAKKTRLINLENQAGLVGKKDITDFINGLGDAPKDQKVEAVRALVSGAEEIRPPGNVEPFLFQAHLPALLDWIERARSGKYLGYETRSFPSLNKALSGIRELIVLSAVPKIGKTTILSQIAHEVSEQGAGVLYYDFENGRYQLMIREICRRYQLSYGRELLSPDYGWQNILETLNEFYNAPKNFAIITDRGLTVEKIAAHVLDMRRLTGNQKVFLAIDSLQKLPVADLRDRRAGVDGWLRNLETLMAEDPDIAIMTVSELSREGKLKESGDIDYTASFVIELEACLDEDEIKKFGDDGRRNLWVRYARDVARPKGPIKLQADFEHWRFSEETP